MEEITGAGSANDATIEVVESPPDTETPAANEVKAALVAEAQRVVDAAKAKVARQQAHLEAAQAILARDEADLAAAQAS